MNTFILISILQKLKGRKMKWLAWGHTVVSGVDDLWLWSPWSFSDTTKPLLVSTQAPHWLKANALTLDASYSLTPANLILTLFPLLYPYSFSCSAPFPASSAVSSLLFILVQPTQSLRSHKHSRTSPVCWNRASLWIFDDSTIHWASAFLGLLHFFISLFNILCINVSLYS